MNRRLLTGSLGAVMLFWASSVLSAATGPSFAEANAAFQKGNFKEAAAAYEKIAASGRAPAEVYYNLGNAYFRLGQKGKALLNYERARRLTPRDKDLLWNLGVLRSTLADRIETSDEGLTAYWVRLALERVALGEAALALCGALFLFAVSGSLLFRWGPLKVLRGAQFVSILSVILAVAVFSIKWAEVREPRVVVLAKQVYARYGPSDKETKAFLLHEGAEVRLRDRTKGWCYISLANKNSGWIPGEACDIL